MGNSACYESVELAYEENCRKIAVVMTRDRVQQLLSEHRDELRLMGVRSLKLFGSTLRGTARPDSDVDLLVEFEGITTFDGYMDVKEALERWLGAEVDLVTKPALRSRMRVQIEREALRVA